MSELSCPAGRNWDAAEDTGCHRLWSLSQHAGSNAVCVGGSGSFCVLPTSILPASSASNTGCLLGPWDTGGRGPGSISPPSSLRGMEGLPTPPPPALGLLLFTCSLGLSVAAPSTPYGWELSWVPFLDKGNRDTPFRESPIHGFPLVPAFPKHPQDSASCLK